MAATPRAMHTLWREYEGLGSGLFDIVSQETPVGSNFVTRLLWGGAMGFAWRYANYTFFVANHELGHGARGVSAGGLPTYQWTGGVNHTSIFTFIGDGFLRFGSGAQTNATWSVNPTNWTTAISAAGMNNSMMFAESLQDEVYYYGGHVQQIGAYYQGLSDAYYYAQATDRGFTGDVSTLISNWAANGIAVSTTDFRTGSLVATAANFTTLAYLWSALRYVGTGDPTVRAFSLGPVKLPDVSFFLNRSGLSYRMRSALKTSATTWIPFSLEYQYKGTAIVEASLGLRHSNGSGPAYRKGAFSVQGYANTQAGFGARLSNDFKLGSKSILTVGTGFFHVNCLEGERSMDRLISAVFGVDAWARFGVVL